jgi:proline iminopeptidase
MSWLKIQKHRKLLALAVFVSAIFIWQYSVRWGWTEPFRDTSGSQIVDSVADMQRVRLGNVLQSITIRGRNVKAPILIWLHGGPGQDETGLWRRYNSILEDHFLVVYWTQRGTGRSYSHDIPAASMTINQFVSDLDELIFYLQHRFGRQKVVLAGHSWGTSIGVAYAQKYPQKVAAYVGISQVVNASAGEKLSYRFALTEAQKRGNVSAQQEF